METRTVVALIALFCCLAPINLQAQADSDVPAKIRQLQEEQVKAQMSKDTSWAQQHLADGFMAGHSWGEWATKAEYIKQLQNTKWNDGKISDVHVATFGPNTAVSHYKFTYDATFNGTHRARSVICSDTWVNDSGTWKSASTHCSVAEGK
jgi:Domain of unknown function (DUF4440)